MANAADDDVAAAAGGAGELRGHRQQAALKDQRFRGRVPPLYPLTRARGPRRLSAVDSATRWGRHLAAVADSIFAQFGSGPRRSLRRSGATARRGGAAAAGRRRHRGDDGARALAAIGAGELRGHRQQAALKDQRFRGRVPPLYPLTRAHEVDSATRWGRHRHAVADSIFAQFGSGPRRSLRRSAERPARAAWAALQLCTVRSRNRRPCAAQPSRGGPPNPPKSAT